MQYGGSIERREYVNKILTKEFLEKEIKTKTRKEIVKETGISSAAIQRRLNLFGLRLHESYSDITNQRFGKLLVLYRLHSNKNHNVIWVCKCDCGKITNILRTNLNNGCSRSCGCVRRRKGNQNPVWKGHGEISGRYWCILRTGAQKRNKQFTINIEYAWQLFLQQNRKCALTGWDINFDTGTAQTASLDRINSNKDYIEGNVQWVHKNINWLKNDYSQQEFIEMCNAVSQYKKI